MTKTEDIKLEPAVTRSLLINNALVEILEFDPQEVEYIILKKKLKSTKQWVQKTTEAD